VSATAQTKPGDRRTTGTMSSPNSVSMYRNARHDSFHRELAQLLSLPDAKRSPGYTSGAGEIGREPPFNWMRRDLARVGRRNT
jgi:hypothetical protein